jgi:hypothetical protein
MERLAHQEGGFGDRIGGAVGEDELGGAWRTKSRIVVSSRAGFLTRAGRARFAARLRFWVIGKSYSDPTSMSGSIRGR